MCFQVLFLGICLGCGQPQITISQVWSPPANAGTDGAVYLKIDNTGGGADRLLSASAKVCRYARFSETDFDVCGPTRMSVSIGHRNSIEIPRGASVQFKPHAYSMEGSAEFEPDGYSMDLESLTKSLAPGETFAVTLKFEKSGTMEVNSEVRGRLDYLEKSRGDKDIANYTEAIRLDPKDPYLYRGRGAAYAGMRRFDEAIADYNEAIRLDPKDPYTYRRRGVAYADMGKFDKAISDYSEAIQLDPESRFDPEKTCAYHARFDRARAYRSKGEYDKAIADYNVAIRLDPDYSMYYHQRGHAHEEKGDCQKASEELSRAIQLTSDSERELLSDHYRCRGVIYCETGDFRKAIGDFKEAIRLDPVDASGWYYSALLRLAAGEVDAYRSECARMLEQFGQTGSGDTAYRTARVCALSPDATADYSNAVALAERAVESDPKSINYLKTLGAILYRAGRLEEAVERLTAASEMMEEADSSSRFSPAYSWYFPAMAHHANEHPEEAKRWLDKAVEWTDKVFRKHEEGTTRLSWNRRLTLKLLGEEAEALLKSTDEIVKPKIPANGEEEARKLR